MHRLVFICGLHRSGTSVLFQYLREHPHISGFRNTGVPEDEGQHLQTVYPPALALGGPGRFGFHREAHLTETSGLVNGQNRRRLLAEWSRHWDLEKRVLLEQSPPNLVRTRFLQAVFPVSCFIVVLRHPVAVAYATQEWSETPLESLLKHWLVCHEAFEGDKPHLRRVCVVRYEDFVGNPQGALDDICDFLGLDGFQYTEKVRRNLDRSYLEGWRQRRDPFSPSGDFDPERLRLQYGGRVARFGYDLDERERTEVAR